jgi:cyclic pyranopterin phosphate synthase
MEHPVLETQMIDVSDKPVTARKARAEGFITMQPETLRAIVQREIKKGDVLLIAQLAGIQGAKKCADLIPLCHPLPLSSVKVSLQPDTDRNAVLITAEVKVQGQTGVEMEALAAVSAAALTVYDMCKAMDRSLCISGITLVAKEGGVNGPWTREESHV